MLACGLCRAAADVDCPAAVERETGDDVSALLQARLTVGRPRAAALVQAGASLCAPNPSDEDEIREVLEEVGRGNWSEDLESAWTKYQAEKLADLERERPAPSRKLRTLIVSPVSSGMLETIAYNARRLTANRAGDTFKFALFHYHLQEGMALPTMEPDVGEALLPHVVYQHAGPGCKVDFWKHLTPEVASGFDYYWLADGDVRVDFFSWDLYRYFLLTVDPLVSQPSIVGWSPETRGTDHGELRFNGSQPMSMNLHLVEMQAPILSAKIWPTVLKRAEVVNGTSAWAVEGIWNAVAAISKVVGCSERPSILVHSPLRHANCFDLSVGGSRCVRNFLREDCFALSPDESAMLARDIGGSCEKGRDRLAWQGACVCNCSRDTWVQW